MRVADACVFRPPDHAAMDKPRRLDLNHVLAASRLARGHLLVIALAAATTIACAALVAA
jgi:hypothetical protein